MTTTIESVRELLDQLPQVTGAPGAERTPPWFKDHENLWFRGHSNSDWLLQPQVLRDTFAARARAMNPHACDSVFSSEASLFDQLRRRGHHLLPPGGTLSNAYFLAQHYGLPTRLLDWTTNPLVALFFAVTEHPDESGALYTMRSRHTIPGEEERDIMYQEDPVVLKIVGSIIDRDFQPKSTSGLPLRIMPDIQSGRMFQQDSRFTLHHPNCRSLDENVPKGFIRKLEIPSAAKRKISEELRLLGVHWATLFPDIPSLVKQIRYEAAV